MIAIKIIFTSFHVIFLSIGHVIKELYRQTTSLNMHLQLVIKMYQLSDRISCVHLFVNIITFNIHNIIIDLGQASNILSKWFIDNYLKANPDKYYALLSEKSDTQVIVENESASYSNCEKLLGNELDQKLSFEPHGESLCKKISHKLSALSLSRRFFVKV